jgi:hypothetical protein
MLYATFIPYNIAFGRPTAFITKRGINSPNEKCVLVSLINLPGSKDVQDY